MEPRLSIIIPTWNTAQITLKCVETIQKYLPPGFAQIIIVDNGSTDNTSQIIKRIHNVTYIRNASNLGFSKGNNIGAKSALASTLLFLNSDMELIDDSLVKMVKYHCQKSINGLTGPKFLNPDMTPQGSVMPPQTPYNAFMEYWLGIPSYSKYVPPTTKPSSVWAVSGGAVLISTTDFNRINGWDEKYFFYYEDLELCRQIRRLGKHITFYPQCQVIHRHGASGTTIANSQNQWRRLIPSSIKYHGKIIHYFINSIIWLSQKLHLPLTK